MKLPFWRTKSAAPAPRIPTWATPYTAGDPPRSYEARVRAAYLDNPVAARAVRLVSEGAGGAPLVSNPPGHPALALLASAGLGASGPGLLEVVAAQLLLHGNAYVEAAIGPDGRPLALFPLRPERVTVEADARGWPVGYLYRAGDVVTRYPAESFGDRPGLLHIRGFHPLDDHYGAAAAWPVRALAIGGRIVLGAAPAVLDVPSGGATIDAEARLAISALQAALRAQGIAA